MIKYKITWYDMHEIKLVEIIYADGETDARDKAYIKYGGKNTPGPCLLVERIR